MKVKLQAELTRLYHMGFALHFLLPKSKRPANSKWTSGPRMNLDQLLEAHQSGYNIGCRLGEVSQVGPGFLAVIDCDVKSELPHHQAEMGKALAQIFPDLPLGTPRVVTGRGNGSCHIYVASPLPATPRRLAQSSEKVRVKMGSVPPSKFEEGTMSPADLKAGWRLRYAWEISVMGEGQQVVMPPSIHPDSGRQYLWGFPIVGADDVPLLDLPGEVKVKRERPDLARNGDFKPCPVDLIGSSLPDSIVDMILTGEGCTDRSAGLFKAAMAMCREKFTDDEIMTVLTDPDTVLGQAAFDHVQTKSRGKAAAWIYQYTVKKARAETNAAADFADDVVVVEAVLGDAEAAAQKAELVSSDWRD